ncbi:glutamine amidotransferase-related protein [Thalassospira marina]|uniref:GMP synthase n=1 Tax=Thalassospira marina TaxID=2048283 RepID=A0ABN5FFS3_9PROT|nr:GMP synthase [Thalassospira marina]AUG53966.1 GMP synthase [Thalassospira marina]
MNCISGLAKVLLVFNSAHGRPGRVGRVLADLGYEFDIRRPGEGEDLPSDLSPYQGVIVFGGPMSANDDHEPNVARIMEWLPRVVDANVWYLGICLGAQMMARNLGAVVRPHDGAQTEIGYYPAYATDAGRDLFPANMMVYHWHSEGFEVPAGGELLMTGDVFPNQAYHVDRRIWGIQFHPEVDDDIHESWLERAADKTDRPNAQNPDQQRAGRRKHDAAFGEWFAAFAGKVLLPTGAVSSFSTQDR